MTFDEASGPGSKDLQRLGLWLRVSGAASIALGVLAVLFPFAATLAVELIFGGVLAATGLIYLARAVFARRLESPVWTFLFALVCLATGAVLLFFPLEGMLALTVVVAGFLVLGGIVKLIGAWALRPQGRRGTGLPAPHGWGWIAMAGAVSVLLGAVLLLGLPVTAFWVLGLLVGVDLIFLGVSEIALAAGRDPERDG